MKLTLRSVVPADLETVYQRFDADLFRYLLPPGAQLLHFGGSQTGDTVHLKLPVAGEWLSEITEDHQSPDLNYFIDEGRTLPFPLKTWHHKHVLVRKGNGTTIEDHMTFSTGNRGLDVLFYPLLWLAFVPRVWQYKKYFKH
jgi:ligand-binding SRPBCC domain-containing protein